MVKTLGERIQTVGPWVPASFLLAFLIVPILALLLRSTEGSVLSTSITSPVVREALALSLVTSLATVLLAVSFGTPLAYLLSRREFRGKAIVESLVDIPLVLPPVVAGVTLLLAFGRMGLAGRLLDVAGIQIGFNTAAVVAAQTFVATPFFVKAARAGFTSVNRHLESASKTLGVSPFGTFLRITLPLSAPSLLAGVAMTWARALGEFGATIMFAGNLAGKTRTLPLAILTSMEEDLDAALAISLVLLAVSFAVLVTFHLFGSRQGADDAEARY